MAIISNDLMGYSKLLYLVWVMWGLGVGGSRGEGNLVTTSTKVICSTGGV